MSSTFTLNTPRPPAQDFQIGGINEMDFATQGSETFTTFRPLAAAAMALLDILITDAKMGESVYNRRIKKFNIELKGRARDNLGNYVFQAHAVTASELEAAVAGAAPDAPAAAAAAAAGAAFSD